MKVNKMEHAQWLEGWCSENVNATVYEDEDEAAHLAASAEIDAQASGISIAKALEELGHGSLKSYMLYALNKRVDEDVKRRANRSD